MQENKKHYAVLTGDFIKSSNFSPAEFEGVKDCLSQAVKQLNKLSRDLVIGKVDFFRGDGWQVLISQPQLSLRCCLFIKAYLRANEKGKTRIAAGIGTVENINKDRISQSSGKAFELSGNLLDSLKKRRYLSVALPYYMDDYQDYWASIFELCGAISQKWTKNQAYAVIWAIQGLKQNEIADKFNPKTKRQNISQYFNGADWISIESVLTKLETKTF